MKLNEITLPYLSGEEARNWVRDNLEIEMGQQVKHSPYTNAHDLSGEVTLKASEFKIKIAKIWGNLYIYHNVRSKITTLESFPDNVSGLIDLSGCANLKNFKGMPQCSSIFAGETGVEKLEDIFPYLTGSKLNILDIAACNIHSLIGIENQVKIPIQTLVLPFTKSDFIGGLGLVLVPGLQWLYETDEDAAAMSAPLKIIQKYLGRSNDIFECQQELIDNGFENMAQL